MNQICIELLHVLQTRHPSAVFTGQGLTIICLNDPTGVLQTVVLDQLRTASEDAICVLDLRGIQLLAARTTNALIRTVLALAAQGVTRLLFRHVDPEVLLGLQMARAGIQAEYLQWAIDHEGRPSLVGPLPHHLERVLSLLKEQTAGVSARDIARTEGNGSSRGTVNRGSVYLQELYRRGLLVREKVPGSNRDQERGWTYRYRPTYSALF